MDRFSRIVVGYHGCESSFAGDLLQGRTSFFEWRQSQNIYDWLGAGIYFWEHSPTRALRWARERHGEEAAVLGAVIQLGTCFDLLDEECTSSLVRAYEALRAMYRSVRQPLPKNRGKEKKLRELDCAVINSCVERLESAGVEIDTVRGAFLEGMPVFPGTTISTESHLQVAVRNVDCILGAFHPNLH